MRRREIRAGDVGRCGLRDYEMLFILATDLDEETANGATERVRTFVATRGGEVHSLDVWGRRRLAYPIERHRDGIFHIAKFSLEAEKAAELDRSLRLNEQIIRHLIIRTDA